MKRHLPSLFLSLSLCAGGGALALDQPGTPAPAKEPGDAVSLRIATETAAAIKALGADPAPKQIAAVVLKAVRSAPGSVLPIVDAAVRESPIAGVPEIVTAATAAVPNPWKQVTYRRLALPNAKKPTPEDDPGRGTAARGADAANGIPMTLAEAIARTAFDAVPGLSLAALHSAVDAALLMHPETLLRNIQSERGAPGMGPSTYGNDPLRVPKQQAVSR